MNTFQFADTNWIHAVWLVLGIGILLVTLELRGRRILELFVSRLLQTRLVYRPSLARRVGAISLAVLAMLMLVLAMMRPQWGMTVQHLAKVGSQVMVCLDVSKSMLAEDVAPNRLDRAKVELDSLLGLMDEDQQVGLIAFAGKATVLCPMTTDFGFLRLVLNETGPNSVGRGGTKIGDAIRKAVDGFRMAGDMTRVILLITDGEDHDSFPTEAAKQAKEKGIKIICIGFGDEAGSKIEITDPKTGIRSFVKDAEGKDVISHLNGDTLRDIALKTEGAFIPAATGALDLESIYRSHIASLLAGSSTKQQRIIHNEIYQWFVVAAICFLLMSLFTATPWSLKNRVIDTSHEPLAHGSLSASILFLFLVIASTTRGRAAAPGPPKPAAASQPAAVAPGPAASSPAATSANPAPTTEKRPANTSEDIDATLVPRAVYNQALAMLATDPDGAERYLTRARRDAGSDGELRFRALYNLGWIEVRRANAVLQKEPKQALQHLQQAANRFRESIRVRPDSVEARQNLELISRRILELTDALNKKDPRDFPARLDELIQLVRQHQAELGALVQRTAAAQQPAETESFRQDYRHLAVTERQIIADIERFAEDAREAQDALHKKPKDKQSAEDKLKAVQYGNMLQFIDRALQRMNRARSLTRRIQGQRAFQRWSTGLTDTKRARDQLRNPVEVIGQILIDAAQLVTQTRQLAAHSRVVAQPQETAAEPPVWLTADYVQDLQQSVTDRTTELQQLLQRIVDQQAANPKRPGQTGTAQAPAAANPEVKRLLDNIRTAVPLIEQAGQHFTRAGEAIKNKTIAEANQQQLESVELLSKAWELFFDIRRLIEVIYQDETLVKQVILADMPKPDAVTQLGQALTSTQQKNLDRCQRLAGRLQAQLDQLAQSATPKAAGGGAAGTAPSAEQIQAEKARLQMAQSLLDQIVQDIGKSVTAIKELKPAPAPAPAPATEASAATSTAQAAVPAEPKTTPKPPTVAKDSTSPHKLPNSADAKPTEPPPSDSASDERATPAKTGPFGPVIPPMDRVLKNLAELRRLFFSLVEHLRDTAQQQASLNDETTQLSGQPVDQITPERVGPLVSRQDQIRSVTQQIAEALKKQSEQAANQPEPAAKQTPASPAPGTGEAEKLKQAAQLVEAAHVDMGSSSRQLQTSPLKPDPNKPPLESARQSQAESLKKLLQALRLLQPEQHKPDQQQQNQNQDQDQQKQQQKQQQQKQQQQNLSAKQLLQLIRDREAERRKDKKNNAAREAPVDKDW